MISEDIDVIFKNFKNIRQISHIMEFQDFEHAPVTQVVPLESDKVDLLSKAASCNPADILDIDIVEQVAQASNIFPRGCEVLPHRGIRHPAERKEYAKLVWRELQCGKLMLRTEVEAVADVFAIAKQGRFWLKCVALC